MPQTDDKFAFVSKDVDLWTIHANQPVCFITPYEDNVPS